jgi:hypothetical protein
VDAWTAENEKALKAQREPEKPENE